MAGVSQAWISSWPLTHVPVPTATGGFPPLHHQESLLFKALTRTLAAVPSGLAILRSRRCAALLALGKL